MAIYCIKGGNGVFLVCCSRFASNEWKRSFQTLEAMLLPIGSLPSRLWKQGL